MGIDLNPLLVCIAAQTQFQGRHLALAADLASPTGPLVTALLDPTQPSQQWLPVYSFAKNGQPNGGVAFINMLSGYAAKYTGNGSPVIQTPIEQIDASSVWTFGTDEGGGYSGYCAVRPACEESQNLNIPGYSPWRPGQGMITWGWGSGDPHPNDIWAIINTSAAYQPAFDTTNYKPLQYWIQSATPKQLVVDIGDPDDGYPVFGNTAYTTSDTQQFLPVARFSNGTSASGFAMISWRYDRAIFNDDLNSDTVFAMSVSHIDDRAIWQALPDDGYNGFFRVMLTSHDNKNLNLSGYDWPPGTEVIAWEWGSNDPAPNDVWKFVPMLVGAGA